MDGWMARWAWMMDGGTHQRWVRRRWSFCPVLFLPAAELWVSSSSTRRLAGPSTRSLLPALLLILELADVVHPPTRWCYVPSALSCERLQSEARQPPLHTASPPAHSQAQPSPAQPQSSHRTRRCLSKARQGTGTALQHYWQLLSLFPRRRSPPVPQTSSNHQHPQL